MNFADYLLDFLTGLIGGGCVVLLSVASIICSISALLSISEENRFFYEQTLKTVGIAISFFGILLLFRSVSLIATLLCFWWTLIIYNIIPFYQILQFVILSSTSFVFWSLHIFRSDDSALQNIPDFIIYVILPFIFTLVNFSRGSDSLSSKDKMSYNGKKIPLRSYLGKCYALFDKVFPQTN